MPVSNYSVKEYNTFKYSIDYTKYNFNFSPPRKQEVRILFNEKLFFLIVINLLFGLSMV